MKRWIPPFVVPVLVACSASPSRPPIAPAPSSASASTARPKAEPAASREDGTLTISDEIRRACGLDTTTPYFAFNSAQLRMKHHPVLDELAVCFQRGALANRQLLLVGHADPRGEHEYNLVLGERRAASVKHFLVTKGLEESKVETSSRGFMDAEGTDEKGWALDRRVDVRLAN